MHTKLRRKGRRLLSAVGPKELLKVISDIYRGKGKNIKSSNTCRWLCVTIVDLSSWQSKLEAPVEDTVDGLGSSSDEETDEEDLDTDDLQGAASSVTTQPPSV